MAGEKEKKSEGIKIEDIPTKFEEKFSLPDGAVVSLKEYLAWIGNLLLEIKKLVE